MSNGKPATAPCGHPGRHVIGSYVECLAACHKLKCSHCGGSSFSPFVGPMVPDGAVSCDSCGKLRWSWRSGL